MKVAQYDALKTVVNNTLEQALVEIPDLSLSAFSTASPDEVIAPVLQMIDDYWMTHEDNVTITIMGHSVGALLARKLLVEADAQQKAWVNKVDRVIMLAGVNKGWTIHPDLSTFMLTQFLLGIVLGKAKEKITGRKPFAFYVRRGNDFIDELNEAYKTLSGKYKKTMLTIQLLGTRDDIVSASDEIDLTVGRNFAYLELPSSNHLNLIDVKDGEEGIIRKKIIQLALTGEREYLKKYRPKSLSFPLIEVLKDEYKYIHGVDFIEEHETKEGLEEETEEEVHLKCDDGLPLILEKLKNDPKVEAIARYKANDGEKDGENIAQATFEMLKLGKLKCWLTPDKDKPLLIDKATIRKVLNEKIKDSDLLITESWLEAAPLQPYTRGMLERYKETHEAASSKSNWWKVIFKKIGKYLRINRKVSLKSVNIVKYDYIYQFINRLVLEDVYSDLIESRSLKTLSALHKSMYDKSTNALCLSGGGIRSASFALGVVQSLARKEKAEPSILEKITYLSTVSGGGYLGGWLSAWMHQKSAEKVLEELDKKQNEAIEPAPIRHLRQYTNYLSPVVGFFSADSWTLGAIYLRNLFLNWLILIPFLAGVVVVPWIIVALLNCEVAYIWALLMMTTGTVLYTISDYYVNKNPPQSNGESVKKLTQKSKDQKEFLLNCLAPGAIGIMCWAIGWYWFFNGKYYFEYDFVKNLQLIFKDKKSGLWGNPYWVSACITGGFVVLKWLLFLGFELAGFLQSRFKEKNRNWERLLDLLRNLVAGAAAGPLIYIAFAALMQLGTLTEGSIIYICLAFPIFIAIILFMSFLYEGFKSEVAEDSEREWASRHSGWFLIVALSWLFVSGMVLYATKYTESGVEFVVSFGGISGYLTAYLGQKSGSPGSPDKRKKVDIKFKALSYLPLSAMAFVAFMVLIVVISHGNIWLLGKFMKISSLTDTSAIVHNAASMAKVNPVWPLSFMLLMFLMAFIFSRYIDSNRFSLHAMYRARLIRAYLGAGRPEGVRRPNAFTGFDESDNIAMGSLAVVPKKKYKPKPEVDDEPLPVPPAKPFHIINVALNLVNGRNLAWQERKAGSFTISPLHAGSLNLGYRNTYVDIAQDNDIPDKNPDHYGGERGISLGTAMTISGAAVSPNMGYNTSSFVAFFMTLFNLRLGAWLGNPGPAGDNSFNYSSPKNFINPVFMEMFGLTNDLNDYVFLSDGGHFENLGLYEMVLRRNRFIIVSDASCDQTCGLEDLGNAIRKIRIDLGVHIDFPWGFDIYPRAANKEKGRYWALGRIRYPAKLTNDNSTEQLEGLMLYLKPGIYGKEPKDIFNYASVNEAFPHESTADQFFTESQFESYRALGFFAMQQAIREIKDEIGLDIKKLMLTKSADWGPEVMTKLADYKAKEYQKPEK